MSDACIPGPGMHDPGIWDDLQSFTRTCMELHSYIWSMIWKHTKAHSHIQDELSRHDMLTSSMLHMYAYASVLPMLHCRESMEYDSSILTTPGEEPLPAPQCICECLSVTEGFADFVSPCSKCMQLCKKSCATSHASY
jgi:hypothetical protein